MILLCNHKRMVYEKQYANLELKCASENCLIIYIYIYRVRQASFLFPSDRSVQRRQLACRTLYIWYLYIYIIYIIIIAFIIYIYIYIYMCVYINVCFKYDASLGTETRMSVHPNYNPNLCRFNLIVLAHDSALIHIMR
jgi:hypothetical protein